MKNKGRFTKKNAKVNGSKGGKSTFNKVGSEGMKKLAEKRWKVYPQVEVV